MRSEDRFSKLEQRMDEAEHVSREDEDRMDALEAHIRDCERKVDRLMFMAKEVFDAIEAAQQGGQ